MVVVDVVVTGHDGKPVAGLKADDFEVQEDGSKEEIKAFGASIAPSPNAPPLKHRSLPPGLFTNTIGFHPEEGAPIILVFDTINTSWEDQAYGRSQLLEYLKKNAGRRNMAIYVLGHRLQLIQDFTFDPEVLEQAASNMVVRRLATQYGDTGNMSISPTGPPRPPSNDPGQLLAQVSEDLSQDLQAVTTADRDQAIALTLEAFRNITRHAGALPGRKELIWLSSGFPLSFDVAANTPFVSVLQETANLLTEAEVAVYPVDISGLVAFDADSMEAGMSYLRSTHAGMYQIASRTGGLALYERNDIDRAIEIAAEDGSTYYVLGYYPKNRNWNGEFRTIHVKVRRPGLQVRSRKGYYALAPEKSRKGKSDPTHAEC
jgi:VWFA-related protein